MIWSLKIPSLLEQKKKYLNIFYDDRLFQCLQKFNLILIILWSHFWHILLVVFSIVFNLHSMY